jgi:hypothetical protein
MGSGDDGARVLPSLYVLFIVPLQASLVYVYKSKVHLDGEVDKVIITKDYWK